MKFHRHFGWALVLFLILCFYVIRVTLHRDQHDFGNIQILWKPGGTPMQVTGILVDRNAHGIAGAAVAFDTDSGWVTAQTDPDGHFSVQVGEQYFDEISINHKSLKSSIKISQSVVQGLTLVIWDRDI